MDIEEFFEELRQEVIVRADASENFTDDAFVEVISEFLQDSGAIEDFTPCSYIHRGVRVDGYNLNLDESLLELYVADCRKGHEPETMSKNEMEQAFKKVETFFERSCLTKFVNEMETSHPAYGLIRTIYDESDNITRVRYYLLTNAKLTSTIKELPPRTESHREWSYRVWDLERLERTLGTGEPEEIVVDFEEMFGHPLVCLPASNGCSEVQSFLTVIPGNWLAMIYDRFGGRLLEQNVRTFLQARGKVNKGIRKTILEEPHRFFPYNNGISATAESVTEKKEGGVSYVTELRNLQIVNGGQTTASIFNVMKKDRAPQVADVSVQMKLSVVAPEIASEIVPKISRFANSQNKISDSDFFSNHPFHVVMEKLSRDIAAPALAGSQILTHWFYERAKGQYANATLYLSPAKKREFLLRSPRNQVISKTDLAKYVQTFRCLPHEVSLGAQKNFAKFADYISSEWEHRQNDFNELWFRRAVVEAIIFRTAERLVLAAPWYAQGYRAQIVTYGTALFMTRVRTQGYELDVQRLWRDQGISEAFQDALLKCCKLAQDAMINGAARNGVINVTEWCKRKACWDDILKIDYTPPSALLQTLKSKEDDKVDMVDARKERKGISEAEAYITVVNAGGEYWRKVREWAGSNDDVLPSDLRLLDSASQIPKKLPNEKSCARLLEIKAIFEG
jgi:hypothetical protein